MAIELFQQFVDSLNTYSEENIRMVFGERHLVGGTADVDAEDAFSPHEIWGISVTVVNTGTLPMTNTRVSIKNSDWASVAYDQPPDLNHLVSRHERELNWRPLVKENLLSIPTAFGPSAVSLPQNVEPKGTVDTHGNTSGGALFGMFYVRFEQDTEDPDPEVEAYRIQDLFTVQVDSFEVDVEDISTHNPPPGSTDVSYEQIVYPG